MVVSIRVVAMVGQAEACRAAWPYLVERVFKAAAYPHDECGPAGRLPPGVKFTKGLGLEARGGREGEEDLRLDFMRLLPFCRSPGREG